MNKLFFLLLISLLFSSCGAFLQKTGVKNYTPKEKISQKGLNKYEYDFLYLTKLVEEGFPQLDSIYPKDERQKQAEQILSTLRIVDNNADFVVQARSYLSNLKNQHTNISLSHEFDLVYPYVIHISSDEWYLLNISRQYDSLQIGKKIIAINGLTTKEVEGQLIDYTFAENKINQQFEILDLQFYNKPQYLKQIGVIKENFELLKLKFEDHSEIELSPISTESKVDVFEIPFKENAITKYQNETYLYTITKEQNFGYLQFNRSYDKIDILEGIESYVKPWLQPIARGYVKRQFKKEKPSKRIANIYNPKYPVFKDFVWELIDSLNTNKVDNLIIDIRNNPGGNLTLGIQLMYFLTEKENLKDFTEYAFTSDIYKKYFKKDYQDLKKKYPQGVPQRDLVQTNSGENLFSEITDKSSKYFIQDNRPIFKGNVYVLSNYRTGSAAAMLTTLFQDNGIGTVIGTSVGNNPIGATTYTPMELPKTKAKISIATTYIERPKRDNGVVQIPGIWIEYTIDDLINGRDPYLKAVEKEIEKISH
ncbi:S41 family peptidase [Belliella marina]|uniref:S41 family peptidase n=1 Tax=Belliella marina TaxID=1644146 RepID=A0ABW4VIU9_9BACT